MKRFGRNQKRALRKEIETLQQQLKEVREINSELDRVFSAVEAELGQYTAFSAVNYPKQRFLGGYVKYEPIFDTIRHSRVFRTNGPSINLCEAIIELCKALKFEQDVNWEYGEGGEACLSDFVIGAFWALTEWHAGQSHITYAALSALGSVFSPGMSGPPDEECSEWTAYELVGKHFERGGM